MSLQLLRGLHLLLLGGQKANVKSTTHLLSLVGFVHN